MALSVVTLPVSCDVSATTDHFTERGEEGERTKFVQFVIILDIQLMPQRGVMAVKWDQMVGRCAAAAVLQCVHTSAANRLIGEVVQSRRRPLLGPSPG